MGRPTRAKLARDFARRSQSAERNNIMRTLHLDKALTVHDAKLSPAAQAVLDGKLAKISLSAEEQNLVGRQVALANEAASKPSWWPSMQAAAEPTEAEAAELAAATAAWELLHAATEAARFAATVAEQAQSNLFRGGYDADNASYEHQRELHEAGRAARATETVFLRAFEAERFADQRCVRARGAIIHNGAQRQNLFVARGFGR